MTDLRTELAALVKRARGAGPQWLGWRKRPVGRSSSASIEMPMAARSALLARDRRPVLRLSSVLTASALLAEAPSGTTSPPRVPRYAEGVAMPRRTDGDLNGNCGHGD